MKFKALQTKSEPKEFIHIDVVEDKLIIYTSDLPRPQPMSATLDDTKHYYKGCKRLYPDQMSFDEMEMVEFEIYEANTVGADIRNKLSPPKNLVAMLEEYFNLEDGKKSEILLLIIKNEMEQTKKSVKYLADLL